MKQEYWWPPPADRFSDSHRTILLRVAANQAVIGLQEAQLLNEQRRAAYVLEERVFERTGQLIALNEDVKSEIIERERAEAALLENEQRLRAILENSPAIIFLKDNSGRYLDCNPPFEKLCGLRRDQIIGKSDWELFPREQATQFCSNDLEVLMAGRAMEFEETALHSDGPHTSLVSKFPLRDRKGHVYALGGIVTDITERKRVEEELRRSEANLADGQRISRTGSWAWNASSKELFSSQELLRIFGLDGGTAKATHETFVQLIHPEDRERVRQAFNRAVDTETDYEAEYRILVSDGSIKHIHAMGHPVFDASGTVTEYVGTVMDITERKRAEEELHTAREELTRASRVVTMGELTASIAHEVNQPLTAVVTNADAGLRWLAGATPNLEEARAALGRIKRDGNRASDVIARIRMLVKKSGTEKEMLEMNEVIQETVALAQGELRRKSVALRTELAGDLPLVQGDRVQLQQVLLNLIMNGMEAMSAVADRPRELVIATWKDQVDKIRVTVKDFGVGLEPPSVERVFEAFYTTKPQGIGIGLSISRSIIEAHNGRLWATRNDGPGATFQFTLPIYDAAAE